MVPNIDPTTTTPATTTPTTSSPGVGNTTAPGGRSDMDKQVAEVTNRTNPSQVKERVPSEEAGETQKSPDAVAGTSATRERSVTGVKKGGQDQAEINFQLTREEREVFLSALSGQEQVEEMSETEQEILQKVAERIGKIIEQADARSTLGRERVEKAVKEWYSRLGGGKYKAPADLLSLIQQASQGKLDTV